MSRPLDRFADLALWVTWRTEKRVTSKGERWTKVPYAIDGRRAEADNPSTWMTRAEAERWAKERGHDGIGIMFGPIAPGEHLGGIDLDACFTGGDDDMLVWAKEVFDLVPTYAEISPSGKGLKLFWLHDPDTTLKERWRKHVQKPNPAGGKDFGIELYFAGRWFAVTDDVYLDRDTVRPVDIAALRKVEKIMLRFNGEKKDEQQRIAEAVESMANGDLSWEDWNTRGMAVYAASSGAAWGYAAFRRWSQKSGKYDEAACEERWGNWRVSPPTSLTAGTIFHFAKVEGGYKANGHDAPPPSSEADYGTAPPPSEDRYGVARRGENKLYREIMDEPDDQPKPLVAELVPAEVVGVFIGSGGAGKGIALQTLCTCVASGTAPFFGYAVQQQGLAIFWTAEDRKRQLLNRQRRICSALGIKPDDVADHLVLTSYREPDCILWKQGRPTSILADLLGDAERLKAKLLVIDSASITYGDDEIKRLEVASYLRYLDLYAEKLGCTIIVILHTSRSSDESVERLSSGSTAWVFQGRFALLLRKDKDDISLVVAKINYGKPGLKIDLQWTDDGVLTHVPAKDAVDSIRDNADDRKLLSIIDIRWNNADAEPFRKNSGAMLRIFMAKEPLNWKASRTEKCIGRLELAGWVGYREGGERRGWYVTENGKKQIT